MIGRGSARFDYLSSLWYLNCSIFASKQKKWFHFHGVSIENKYFPLLIFCEMKWDKVKDYVVCFPHSSVGKESACNAGDLGSIPGFDSWVRKIPWRRNWQCTPVFLPGKSHGQRSLVGYSPWDHKGWTWLSNWTNTTTIQMWSIIIIMLYIKNYAIILYYIILL